MEKDAKLAKQLIEYRRLIEAGKNAFKYADALMAELVETMGTSRVVQLNAREVAVLVDEFAGGKTTVWRAHSCRRYSLTVFAGKEEVALEAEAPPAKRRERPAASDRKRPPGRKAVARR